MDSEIPGVGDRVDKRSTTAIVDQFAQNVELAQESGHIALAAIVRGGFGVDLPMG